MKEKNVKLVIYDVDGEEHIIEITRKEAFGIIKSLVEAYE